MADGRMTRAQSPETTMVDFEAMLQASNDAMIPGMGAEAGSNDRTSGVGRKGTQGKSRAEIRRARAARNRCSARRSRLRKKAENERDREKAMVVERRNATLKRRVAELRDKMVGLQRVVTALGLGEEAKE